MLKIGSTAKKLREKLGWTQRATADALGVSWVHLCNVENNKKQPSQALLDRYRSLWGIDLYVFAWCDQGQNDRLPLAIRDAAIQLATAWRLEIEGRIVDLTGQAGATCSSSGT